MIPKPGAIIIEGHVQGLSNTRALGSAGIPVYVVDKNNCVARYSKYCKKFFRCPEFILDDFALFLIDLAQQEDIRDWVLIPSNDHAVWTISKNKSELLKYYKVITPGLEIIDNIYDKSRLLAIAEDCGVPIPETLYFKSVDEKIADDFSFPAITRGKHGLSFYKTFHKKVLLANNKTELRQQLKEINDIYQLEGVLTQELIPFDGTNKTISFAAFCENGEIKAYWMGVKLREHPLNFGTATFAKSVYEPECYRLSIPLIKALQYTGVCEIEYLFDPITRQYKLIEINARTWLWVGLAKACGVDFAKMIYAYENHEKIEYPRSYETDKYWVNPVTDTVYAAKALLKKHLNPLVYAKSILNRKKVNALFVRGDWKPGLAYCLSLFKFYYNR